MSSSQEVILRFLLEGTHTLDVIMYHNEANRIIDSWRNENKSKIYGYDRTQNRTWVVDPGRVLGIFTIDMQQLQNQQQSTQQKPQYGNTPFNTNLSGRSGI